MTAPRRRWSFTLRTLFVFVGAICCFAGYVGWQSRIVAHRSAMLRLAAPWKCTLATGTHHAPLFDPYCARCQVSFLRRLLGDEGVFAITFWGDIPDADLERIAAAFPEAVEVNCLHWSRGLPAIVCRDASSELPPPPAPPDLSAPTVISGLRRQMRNSTAATQADQP